MPASETLLPLFQDLASLMELEGEYLSHRTALFLLGQIPDLPAELTAVSPRRRRNRTVGPRPLVFVFHPGEKPRHIQVTAFGKISLPVSTLEKTLLDLLADMHHAPPLDELAALFVRLPYHPATLVAMARQASDTVLKRTCFLAAWAGRIHVREIPFAAFRRTPVKLDPREPATGLAWDNRFFLKVPSRAFRLPLPPGPANLDPDIAAWVELRRSPAFQEWMAGEGRLPILGDHDGKELDGFFGDLFRDIPAARFDDLFHDHFGRQPLQEPAASDPAPVPGPAPLVAGPAIRTPSRPASHPAKAVTPASPTPPPA
ncbi:MAG: hypothetical protein GX442_26455, partial [Candidatus Riflebacteria bacterium]|nr:hypothetical protein [Candidatus Riflebacteria bacterium]